MRSSTPARGRFSRAGACLSVLLLLGVVPQAWAGDDVQSWVATELVKRVTKTVDLFFRPEIRIRDDIGELFYHEFRQGVRWAATPHWGIALNYLFARNTPSDKLRDEHTGELDITPKGRWGPFDVSARGRVALRQIQGSAGEQEWQWRIMPRLAYPTTLAGRVITPYVADDLFYDYTRKAFNQNRFFLGVGIPLAAPRGTTLKADLYYMLQSQLGSVRHDWSENHVVGAALTARFD